MKIAIVAAGVLLASTVAALACTTTTYIIDGKHVTCTRCNNGAVVVCN